VHALPKTLRAGSATELKERFDAARRDAPFVLYRDGDERQRIVVLDEHESLTIGRQCASDVPLPWDEAVSRVHATLERVGEEWTLVDDGSSRNGSFLNGIRVRGRRRLQDGDLIRVGYTTMAYVVPRARELSSSTVAATSSGVPHFTTAQRRVLVALCRPFLEGRLGAPDSNQQIAGELFLGIETVKTHMHALFEAFGIQHLPQNRKRGELVRLALERGAVSEDELLAGAAPLGSGR
jgi:pSer/pThr/pTyr-binding forkhead associated (FHA) protein